MPMRTTWCGRVTDIRAELEQRVMELRQQGKLLEAQRLLARTKYDCEMLQEMGYLLGDRELLAAPGTAAAGGEALHADGLFPEGLPADHRRDRT